MAKKIGVVLALDGEQKFAQGMKNASKEVSLMKTELKNVESEFKGSANTIEALTKKQEALSKVQEAYSRKVIAANTGLSNAKNTYKEQAQALDKLTKELEKARKAQKKLEDSGDKTSDEYKQQTKAVEELSQAVEKQGTNVLKAQGRITDWSEKVSKSENELKQANDALKQNERYLNEASSSADHCATSIDRFGNEVKDVADDLDDAGKEVMTFGDMLAANITADLIVDGLKKIGEAAVEAGKYVIDVGSNFEQAMSKVGAISGASGRQLDMMSAKAKQLSSSIQFSATEVAEGFQYMSLAGWDAQQSIDAMDGVLNLAAASGMELATASDAITDYLSAFGMEAKQATQMADMLAFAQANSNTSAQQLVDAYGNAAAGLHAAGQDIETVTSLLEGMANQGLKGSEAGTALNAIMSQITQKMKDGAIQIGETSIAVQDQNGNFRDLTDILKDVETATDGMGTSQKSAALASVFNRTALSGLNLILNEGVDKISKYEEALRHCDGAASDMAKVMNDNLKGDITQFGSALEGLGIELFGLINEPLRGAVELATGVISDMTGVISGISEVVHQPKTDLEQFVEDVQTANDKVQESLDKSKQIMEGGEAQASKMEHYKQILMELADAGELNQFQQYQAKAAIDALKDSIPGLADAFDETTGSITMSSSAIDSLISKQEELIRQSAAMEARTEVYKAKFDADYNAVRAQSGWEESLKRVNEYFGTNIQSLEEFNAEYNKLLNPNDAVGNQLVSTAKSCGDAWSEASDQVTQAEEDIQSLEETLSQMNSAVARGTTSINESANSVQGAVDEHIALKHAMQETGDTAKETAENVDELNESFKEVDGAQVAEQAIDSLKQKYTELRTQIENDIQNKISLFDGFDGGTDMTAEDMLSNLQSQYEGLQNWESNMEILAQHVGKEISPEFYNSLIEMGTEGVNAVQHMVTTLQEQGDEGAQIIKDMSDTWTANFELSESLGEKFAGMQMAIQSFLGEVGSTEVDFSNLRSNIETQIESAADGWSGFTEATRAHLDEALAVAEEIGIKIPDGLAESIANGEIDINGALESLQSSIQGQFQGLAEIAEEYGVKLPEGLQSAIESGEGLTQDTWQQMCEAIFSADLDTSSAEAQGEAATEAISTGAESGLEELSSTVEDGMNDAADAAGESASTFEEKGQEAGESYGEGLSSGIESGIQNATSSVDTVTEELNASTEVFRSAGEESGTVYAEGIGTGMESASSSVEAQIAAMSGVLASAVEAFRTAGTDSGNAFAEAISAAQSSSAAAGQAIASAAQNGAASHVSGFFAVGMNMSQGLASGIASGGSAAIAAAASVAAQALAAAKAALDIHSPSRKFRKEVGQQVGKGFAFGIKDSAKLAINESAKLSTQVYKNAVAWVKNYRKSNKMTVDETVYFWNQIVEKTKEGSSAYNKAMAKVANAISSSVSKTTGEGKNKKQKDAETYYSDIYKAAQTYAKNQQILNEWSEKKEIAYWTNMRKHLKAYTQAWFDATEQINKLKEAQKKAADDARKAKFDAQGDILDTIKTVQDLESAEMQYWKGVMARNKEGSAAYLKAEKNLAKAKKNYLGISLRGEMQYWDIVRKQYKKGTEERIKADEEYLAAREEYYSELNKLKQDYYDDQTELRENAQKEIDALKQANKDLVKSAEDSIKSQMNLFEEYDPEGYTKDILAKNLKSQVMALRVWKKNLEDLRLKALPQELIEELEEMGPDAAANIWSLNQMTADELDAYVKMWKEKNKLVHTEAVKITANEVEENNKKITEIKDQLKIDLEDLKKEYDEALKTLNTGLTTEMKTLIKQASDIGTKIVDALVAAIKKGNVSGALKDLINGNSVGGSLSGGTLTPSNTSSGSSVLGGSLGGGSLTSSNMGSLQGGSSNSNSSRYKIDEANGNHYAYKKSGDDSKENRISNKVMNGEKVTIVKTDSKTSNKVNTYVKFSDGSTGWVAGKHLKKYARGIRKTLEDELGLTQEEGREIMMSGTGAMTYIPKGSSVMPNKLSENMFAWGEINPTDLISSMRSSLDRQNDMVRQQFSLLSNSGVVSLNRATENFASDRVNVNVDNSSVANMMQTMLNAMQNMVDAIGEMKMVTDTGVLAGQMQSAMSRENAAVQIRRQRGRI